MTELIKRILGIPVQEDLSAAVPNEYAVVDVYAEETALSGEGSEEEAIARYQVDIFYKNGTMTQIRTAAKTLKAAIKTEYGELATIPAVSYSYDVLSRYRRATLTFQILEEN